MRKLSLIPIALMTSFVLSLGGAGVIACAEEAQSTTISSGGTSAPEFEVVIPRSPDLQDEAEEDSVVMPDVKTHTYATYAEIVADTMPAMVSITNKSVVPANEYYGNAFGGGQDFFRDFFGNGFYEEQEIERSIDGSGFILDEDADYYYIASNAHVVNGANELSVKFIDDTAAPAEVISYVTEADLAVIRVRKTEVDEKTKEAVKVISIGKSSDLKVGEEVLAIGNALGYGQSVSKGIVSALDRTVQGRDDKGEMYEMDGMIQTDASINPGNSGGALLNLRGELVGINAVKTSSTAVEGMGYAISIDKALPILQDMMEGDVTDTEPEEGHVTLGILCSTIPHNIAEQYNAPDGVIIHEVEEGSAAEKAGMKVGDIITKIDDVPFEDAASLKQYISTLTTSDTIDVTVMRPWTDAFGKDSYQQGVLTVVFDGNADSGPHSQL